MRTIAPRSRATPAEIRPVAEAALVAVIRPPSRCPGGRGRAEGPGTAGTVDLHRHVDAGKVRRVQTDVHLQYAVGVAGMDIVDAGGGGQPLTVRDESVATVFGEDAQLAADDGDVKVLDPRQPGTYDVDVVERFGFRIDLVVAGQSRPQRRHRTCEPHDVTS